jgi:hypothetical protein
MTYCNSSTLGEGQVKLVSVSEFPRAAGPEGKG